MRTTPIPDNHCSTNAPGWLDGNHPTLIGETIDARVCFVSPSDSCSKETQIQIRNCYSYYLYYLVETPICSARYCSDL